jgi:hypothetical protein
MSCLLPTTDRIRDVFAWEVTEAGGTVTDTFDDRQRLFLRSVLPELRHVRSGDPVQGGVALMCLGEQIRVHPYTFRQVCRNGAIMAEAIETRVIERVGDDAPDYSIEEVCWEVAEAVRLCADREAFAWAAQQMRSATASVANMMLQLMPFLRGLPEETAESVLEEIERRFDRGRDRSAFGLMNAVTATARDTRDPELRWRLEELGGAIPALVAPVRSRGGTWARATRT